MNRIQRAIYTAAGIAAKFFDVRTWAPSHDHWYKGGLLQPTSSGVDVDETSAITFSAVWACVKRLSETVAITPPFLFESQDDDSRIKRKDLPLWDILHKQANPWMSARQWRQTMTAQLALWGNAYSWIERSPVGNGMVVTGLYPLNPSRVDPFIDPSNGRVRYKFRKKDGTDVFFEAMEIFHPRLFSWDGIHGLSPITHARESIGLGLAAQEYGARLFSNDASPGGTFKHPGNLSDKAYNRLKEDLIEKYTGLVNRHKPMILEDGMTFESVGMPARDAQFLESRKFQVTEVARFYGIQPHMIQDLDRSTNNNIEQQSLEFVKFTMMPWFSELEQEAICKLLIAGAEDHLFIEFNVDALLRGDLKSRYEAYAIGKQWGWLSTNDIRRRENLDPVGDGGEDYWAPLNMIPADLMQEVAQSMIAARGPNGNGGGDEDDAPSRLIDPVTGKTFLVTSGSDQTITTTGTNPTMTTAMIVRSPASRRGIIKAHQPKLIQVASKIVDIEALQIAAQVSRLFGNWGDMIDWLRSFYSKLAGTIKSTLFDDFLKFATEIMQAAADEVDGDQMTKDELEEFVQKYIDGLATRWTSIGAAQITKIINAGGSDNAISGAIITRIEGWTGGGDTQSKGVRYGKTESVVLGSVTSKFTWIKNSIEFLVWITNDPCPICEKLNGKVVGIRKSFAAPGDKIGQMTVGRRLWHPPAHDSCQCTIGAR